MHSGMVVIGLAALISFSLVPVFGNAETSDDEIVVKMQNTTTNTSGAQPTIALWPLTSLLDQCFPASTEVESRDGTHIKMADLRVGADILAADEAGNLLYSKVLSFLHRDPASSGPYLTINVGNRQLSVSAAHFLLSPSSPLAAASVSVGHRLTVVTPSDGERKPQQASIAPVSSVAGSPAMVGRFAPLTTAGSLVADGVLASCFAYVHPRYASWLYAPVRTLNALGSMLTAGSRQTETETEYNAPRAFDAYSTALAGVAAVLKNWL